MDDLVMVKKKEDEFVQKKKKVLGTKCQRRQQNSEERQQQQQKSLAGIFVFASSRKPQRRHLFAAVDAARCKVQNQQSLEIFSLFVYVSTFFSIAQSPKVNALRCL